MIKNKLWKLLYWLSPFFLVAGLTVGLITEKWGIISLVLIILAILIFGIWIVRESRQNKWWKQRSTQSATNALLATLAVLTILGLINFLGTRYHLRVDLTETQLFTLAPQTKQIVKTLPETVKVWLFTTDKNALDQELLENYQRQSAKFKYEYIDPQSRPGLAEKFKVKDFGEVYLEFGKKRQLVQIINNEQRLSEIRLTNRLQQIISTNTVKAYFLQGHREHPLLPGKNSISAAVQGLSDRNFTTSPLNLAENPQIPEDAAVIIVAGPQRELFPGEVKALQDYQNRGGNLMLMIAPNTDPKIDSLLQEWGVKLDNRLAIDISGESLGLGPAAPIITEYGEHPITKDFGNGISFYPVTRPLEIIPISGIEFAPLLKTKPYPSSWGESDQQSEKLEFNEDKDIKGPLTLGVALTRNSPIPTTSPIPKKESRLVVIGNSDFATDGLFEQQLNGDVFLNSITWLSQQDQKPLSIRPKEPRNRRINLSSLQANLLTLSALLLLPLIGLATSAIIWWKRR